MKIRNVIVGAGYAGSVIARRIAEERGEDVLIVEKHDHVGGHAFDHYNEFNVLVHKYGPHIFHTNNAGVWTWLSRFTDWYLYQHRVLSYVDGKLVPLPIGADTINELLGLSLSTEEFKEWIKAQIVPIADIKSSEDVILSQGGRMIYEKFFKNYTMKQWERSPAELDASVTKRIPFRDNRDARYFSDRYQGLPKRGYTAMFANMLDNPKIHFLLNTRWEDVKDRIEYERLYYTGPLDAFFGKKYGDLPYRSVRFEYETFFDRQFFQSVGTVNYPNDYDFTRITEYKYLTGQSIACTTIAREYSQATGEPFYIVPGNESAEALAAYKREAEKLPNVVFVGRLAEYKYYNMDQIVERALGVKLA
jgi:UDP-galactopyranose mutase